MPKSNNTHYSFLLYGGLIDSSFLYFLCFLNQIFSHFIWNLFFHFQWILVSIIKLIASFLTSWLAWCIIFSFCLTSLDLHYHWSLSVDDRRNSDKGQAILSHHIFSIWPGKPYVIVTASLIDQSQHFLQSVQARNNHLQGSDWKWYNFTFSNLQLNHLWAALYHCQYQVCE